MQTSSFFVHVHGRSNLDRKFDEESDALRYASKYAELRPAVFELYMTRYGHIRRRMIAGTLSENPIERVQKKTRPAPTLVQTLQYRGQRLEAFRIPMSGVAWGNPWEYEVEINGGEDSEWESHRAETLRGAIDKAKSYIDRIGPHIKRTGHAWENPAGSTGRLLAVVGGAAGLGLFLYMLSRVGKASVSNQVAWVPVPDKHVKAGRTYRASSTLDPGSDVSDPRIIGILQTKWGATDIVVYGIHTPADWPADDPTLNRQTVVPEVVVHYQFKATRDAVFTDSYVWELRTPDR